MSLTFDLLATQTVLSTYSWDDGTPLKDFGVTIIEDLSAGKTLTRVKHLTGYAPFFTLLLSSDPHLNWAPYSNTRIIQRTVDFGDYYNSETNIVTQKTTIPGKFYVCHTYIMPGTYKIKYSQTQYVQVTASEEEDDLYKTYIQSTGQERKNIPLSWKWFNFLQESKYQTTNNPLSWGDTEFQQANQLTWKETVGECFNLNAFEDNNVVWNWNNIKENANKTSQEKVTWNDASSTQRGNTSWNFASVFNQGKAISVTLSSLSHTIQDTIFVTIKEIMPTAYLAAAIPGDLNNPIERELPLLPITECVSPFTVKLTPRFTKCGSFPIEKIVWDLGDGSPLITQQRWAPNYEPPFYFSGSIRNDIDDPRNFDIIHTYIKTPTSSYSFYPSITAYASSTNSSDACALVIGPLKLPEFNVNNVSLLQNELTDNGKIFVGQIGTETVIWRADK